MLPYMGRPKLFDREDVLRKALPVFWRRGYADTAVQELEKATGVNKSGLYSEFKDKEDIFVESLRYYYSTRLGHDILNQEPLGWANIENFLKYVVQQSSAKQKGCFGVNSMRELELLPPEARALIAENRIQLKRLFAKNIAAEKTKMPPEAVSELLSTFFSGFCIEQNLKASKASLVRKVEDFIAVLRSV